MKKIFASMTLVFCSFVGISADPVGVTGVTNPVNLFGGVSGQEALSPSTDAVGFLVGATTGGFDVQLTGPVLLDKVQMSVTGTAVVLWQALKGDEVIELWSRQQDGLYDLSGNGVVADRLRLVATGADLGSVTLGSIVVYGEDPGAVPHRILPKSWKASSQTSFFFGPENVSDGSTGTDWTVFQNQDTDSALSQIKQSVRQARPDWWHDWSGAYDTRLNAVFPPGKRIAEVQVSFGPQATGSVEVLGLFSGQWKTMGSIDATVSAWASLVNPFPNDVVSEVQIIAHPVALAPVQVDLGEVFFWGSGNWAGDDYQDPTSPGSDASGNQFGFYNADLGAASTPYFEFALQGQGTSLPSVEVDGQSLGTPTAYAVEGTTGYYRVNVAGKLVNQGPNLIWVRGITGQWGYGRLHAQNVDGSARWTASEGTLGDGWKYLPLQSSMTQYPLTWLQSGGQFQLYGDGALQTGSDQAGWVEPPFVPTFDGKIYPHWPAGTTLKLVPGPLGIGEVRFSGVTVSSTVPLQVLWPQNGQQLSHREVQTQILVGHLSSLGQTLLVNGQAVQTKGSLFWIPLADLGLQKGQMNTVTVSATTTDGTVTTQVVGVGVDTGSLWVPGIGTGTVKSSEETYTLSGQTLVSNVQVFLGNHVVDASHSPFTLEVPLQAGVNTLPVRLVWKPTGAILDSFTATVLSTAQGIVVSVTGEGQTSYVNQAQYQVSGTVVAKSRVRLTVNGQPTTVNGYQFQSAVTLIPGLNTVTVSASDSTNSVTKTISVYLETGKPTLTVSSPGLGQWFSQQLTISGKVVDAAPAAVWVNGIPYNAASGSFSFSIPVLLEGQFTYEFQSQNRAGTLSDPQSVTFGVDNTNPLPFAIGANVSGWTNNNRPILSFATTDAVSGVNHYEASINQGAWTSATSPLTLPVLAEGVDTIRVKAIDNAGNSTTQSIDLSIDTVPPVAVVNLRAVPGTGTMDVLWGTNDNDILEYHVIRTPVWPDGEHVVNVPEVKETGLPNGEVYSYTVVAEDHAHNLGPRSTTSQSITGLTVTPIVASTTQPTVVEFENLKAVIPAGSLPDGNVAVLVKEITSPTMSDASSYPIVSPIYSMSTLAIAADGSLQETGHSEFSKEVLMILDYDPTQLPNGFPETNLGVYYFDTTWSKWFKIEKSSVDTTLHKIVFTTNHFTDFSVQPTMISDLSPQQLKDIGHSPIKTESSAGAVTVSPQGGTAMTEVTDFVLPGRNGFTLPIKRMYDTGTALADSPSLSLSASLTFNDFGSLLDLAKVGAQLVSQGVNGMVAAIKSKVSNVLKQNGDYALAAGVGWRLNMPYVLTTNTSVAVRLPDGGYYNVNQMHSNNSFWASNPVSRVLDFENHEGVDFHFKVTQVRGDITDVAGALAGLAAHSNGKPLNDVIGDVLKDAEKDPSIGTAAIAVKMLASLIPGWLTLSSELWTKDGSSYLFDGSGRIVRMQDRTGLNTYRFHYNGLLLNDITDDLGRQVLFQYNDNSVGSTFARPVMTRIWTKGFQNYEPTALPGASTGQDRGVNLNYDFTVASSMGTFFNFLPKLDSSTDTLGRRYSYAYHQLSIITGGGSVKINFLALLLDFVPGAGPAVSDALGIAALTLSGNIELNFPYVISRIEAPGIGTTDIAVGAHDLSQFDFKPTDYFLGLLPTALQVSYQILFRLNTDWVKVTSSTGVVRTTNYTYNWSSHSTINGTQYYVNQTTVDDGRTKVVHQFSANEVWRNRFISWDDWLVASAQELFESELYIVPELYTLESGSTTYDQTNGGVQIESVQNSWDLSHHRLTSAVTTRGPQTVSSLSYDYDDWGNQTHIVKDEVSNGIEQKNEQWNWYLNSGSSKPASWAISDLGVADENLGNGDTRNLLKGSLVWSYCPEVAGGGYQEILKETSYNAYGLKKAEGLWTGTHWATTTYAYFLDPAQLSAGAMQSKTGPLTGQLTTWTYDYSRGSGSFYTVTQTTPNVADPAGTTSSLVQEVAYDWNTGWKLYDKDPRGYLTEYAYDPLSRLTDTIKPGDEAALAAGSWSVVYTHAPWEHIAYDDSALTASVYRSSYTTSGTNPVGNLREKYTYDNLGQLITIDKFNASPYQDSQTQATYTGWGEVASMTDPNSNTTSYTYDALGKLARTTHADGSFSESTYSYGQNLKSTTNERGIRSREWMSWNDQPLVKVEDVGTWNITTQSLYDGLGQLVAQTDALNQTTVTTYGPFGKPTDVKHPAVDTWQGSAASPATYPQSLTPVTPEEAFTYDDAGQLITQQSGSTGNWHQIDQVFDLAGRVIKKTVGVPGVDTRQEWSWYDANGNLVKHADPLMVTQILADPTKAATTAGFSLKAYSSRNKVLTETDPAGAVVRYLYDLLDRKIQMKDPRSSATGTDNFTINYGYNDLDRLVSADLPAVAGRARGTQTITYDLRGNAIGQVDPSGRTTSWNYDNRNHKIGQSVTGADGTGPLVSAWTYDAVGNQTKEILGGTLTTTKLYDGLNRLTETDLPDGQKQITGYDLLGRPTSVTDAVGNTTYQSFNSLNKIVLTEDPTRNKTLNAYDLWGDQTATQTQNSVSGDQVWVRAYNPFAQVIAEHNNAGQSWSSLYDVRGLVQSVTDPNGTLTTNTYTVTGLLTNKVLTKPGSPTLNQSWTYDLAGSLSSATDGNVTTRINQASGAFVADPYDLINSYSTSSTANGVTKTLALSSTYDNAHLPLTLTYPDATVVTSQYNGLEQLTAIPGYASGGSYNALGRLTSLSAANGTKRTKSWDQSTGNLTGYNWGVASKTARTMEWDNRGNLASQTKEGKTSNYQYDSLNRLSSTQEGGNFEALTDPSMSRGSQLNDVAGVKPLDFSDPYGTVKLDYFSSSIGVDLINPQSISKMRLLGITARIMPHTVEVYLSDTGDPNTWAKLSDTTWLQDETGVTLQFSRPQDGRFIKLHSTWDERNDDNTPLDKHALEGTNGQLLQVWYLVDGQTTAWTYDSQGNRLIEYQTRGSTTETNYSYYPFTNRIKSAGNWSFNYDANGNLTSRGTNGTWDSATNQFYWDPVHGELWNYVYDLKNRLISAKRGLNGSASLQPTVDYTYDIRNLKVAETKPVPGKTPETRYFQYDQSGDLLYTDNGMATIKYIQALGQTWAETRTLKNSPYGSQPVTYWHSTDHEGSTNVITDLSGNIVWDGDYEAFGSMVRSNGTLDFTPSYTGKQFDMDTGLYYCNARFYEPTLGRFITEDPARSGGNWYEYGNNNPLRFVDPTGLDAINLTYAKDNTLTVTQQVQLPGHGTVTVSDSYKATNNPQPMATPKALTLPPDGSKGSNYFPTTFPEGTARITEVVHPNNNMLGTTEIKTDAKQLVATYAKNPETGKWEPSGESWDSGYAVHGGGYSNNNEFSPLGNNNVEDNTYGCIRVSNVVANQLGSVVSSYLKEGASATVTAPK